MSDIQVFRKRITPEQKKKRQLIVAETMQLITQQGSALSMESVATASGVSRTTLYRYYTSREHLLAEVTLSAGNTLIKFLENNPPTGKTIGERIENLCHMVTKIAGENEQIMASCISNLSSEDPAVIEIYHDIEKLISGMLGSVLGDSKPKNAEMMQSVVFRYLLGSFNLATTGKLSYSDVASELTEVCHLLLDDVWDSEI